MSEFADTLHQELTTGEIRHAPFTGVTQWEAGLRDPLVKTQRTHGETCVAWWEKKIAAPAETPIHRSAVPANTSSAPTARAMGQLSLF